MFLVKPDAVPVDGFFLVNNSNCSSHRVQWQRLETGCAVKYNIEFLDTNGGTLDVKTVTGNNSFFCTDNYDNVSSMIVWATFKNETGVKSRVVPLQTTTTTTATTTTTTTPGKGDFVDKNRCYSWSVVIIM